MIEEAYVSYETARLLEEKEFDEGCIAYWFAMTGAEPILNDNMPRGHYNNKGNNIDIIGCPTQSLAMRWLREVHNKHCNIGYDIDLGWFFQIIDLKETVEYDYPETKYYHTENETGFNTYEEAVEAALKYCLENLI